MEAASKVGCVWAGSVSDASARIGIARVIALMLDDRIGKNVQVPMINLASHA
jgi:hypothetical protein